MRTESWTPEERAFLRPLFLLTLKDVLALANVGEDDLDGHGEGRLKPVGRVPCHRTLAHRHQLIGEWRAVVGRPQILVEQLQQLCTAVQGGKIE